MPSYNNSDSYINKPRSYREARKRRATRSLHETNKWHEANQRKRYEMKFRNNRRYDKLYIVPFLGMDDPEEDVIEETEDDTLSISSSECNIDYNNYYEDMIFVEYVYKRMRDCEDDEYETRVTKIMRTECMY